MKHTPFPDADINPGGELVAAVDRTFIKIASRSGEGAAFNAFRAYLLFLNREYSIGEYGHIPHSMDGFRSMNFLQVECDLWGLIEAHGALNVASRIADKLDDILHERGELPPGDGNYNTMRFLGE